MKYFKIITIALALVFVLGACTDAKKEVEKAEQAVENAVEATEEEIAAAAQKAKEEAEKLATEAKEKIEDVKDDIQVPALVGLKEGEYPELEFTAAILERKAILPGQPFKVHVNVKNNGTKPVGYVHGSGGAVVPSALVINSSKLQYVPPVEELGPMTMDLQVKTIEPGAGAEFVLTFIATEPTDDFLQKAMDYKNDTGEYIGDKAVEDLGEIAEGLTPVATGSYQVDSYFLYSVLETSEDLSPVNNPTGFAKLELVVGIN